MKIQLLNLQKQLVSLLVSGLASERVDGLNPHTRTPAHPHTGSILVLVLWALSLLTVFALSLSYQARQKIALVRRLDQISKAYLAVDAAAKKAVTELIKEGEKSYTALKDMPINSGAGPWQEISFTDIKAFSTLADEEGKININKAPAGILENLFQLVLGFDQIKAQELAASVVDWRDADSELSLALGSAEDSDYRSQKFSYEASDAEFQVPEELLLVKGMTQEIFEKLKNYVTIYGAGRVNINTASKEVILSLGVNSDMADKIILFRNGEDEVPGTSDDNIFEKAENIAIDLNQAYNLDSAKMAEFSVIQERFLVIGSDNFMINIIAQSNSKKEIAKVACVADRKGKILYWQES